MTPTTFICAALNRFQKEVFSPCMNWEKQKVVCITTVMLEIQYYNNSSFSKNKKKHNIVPCPKKWDQLKPKNFLKVGLLPMLHPIILY